MLANTVSTPKSSVAFAPISMVVFTWKLVPATGIKSNTIGGVSSGVIRIAVILAFLNILVGPLP